MFLRLTKAKRIRLGWLVALAYLFCVLAPAAVLAAGDAAPCLTDELPRAVSSRHQATGQHMHDGRAMHDDAGMHAHHRMAAQDAPAPQHHDGKGSPGPCCAMMCVTALPADLPDIAK